MNTRTRRRLLFGSILLQKMQERRSLIYANLTVCAGMFVLGVMGNQYKFAIGSMALVQSVNIPMLYETYLEHNRQNPKLGRDEPPRNKR